MTEIIHLRVRGLPKAQGSMRAFTLKSGRTVVTSATKGLKAWRTLIALQAQNDAPEEPAEGPVAVEIDFTLPKPKSEPKTRRTWPDRRPDLDKLVRAVLDALTGVVFRDDGQVVELRARKDWGPPGVLIWVREVTV